MRKLQSKQWKIQDTKKKTSTLFNVKEFWKGRKMFLITFENDIFQLPIQYPSGMDDWEEDDINSSIFLPKRSTLLLSSPRNKETIIIKKNIVNQLSRLLFGKNNIINKELSKKYFEFQGLNDMKKEIYRKHKQKLRVTQCD